MDEQRNRRLDAVNELAQMLDNGLITYREYIKNAYHAVLYWYHEDMINRHKHLKHKHQKWLRDEVEVLKLREDLMNQ